MMAQEMEARYKLEIGDTPENEVTALSLDNVAGESLSVVTDKLTSLVSLSAINCGITSLKGLPKLETLKRLELADNKLTTSELEHLVNSFPNLESLGLAGNRLEKTSGLSVLKSLTKLTSLDIFGNPLQDSEEKYRNEVFALIEHLKYLNAKDKDGADAPSDSDEEDEEDFEEESEVDSDESEEESDEEEEDGPGLEYLNSSKILEDDDETEWEEKKAAKRKAEDKNEVSPKKQKAEETPE